MRYDQFAAKKTENLSEAFGLGTLGKWIAGFAPGVADSLGGQDEMNDYIDHYYKNMMNILGRWRDKSNRQITRSTLQELPTRAVYVYLNGGMNLPDEEIERVLRTLNKQFGSAVTLDELSDEDNRLEDIFGRGIDAKKIEDIFQKLIAIASIRRMELTKFKVGSREPTAPKSRTSVPSTKTTSDPNAGWKDGEPITLKDGTVIQPTDANYSTFSVLLRNKRQADQAGL